jgi:hypothetical protein
LVGELAKLLVTDKCIILVFVVRKVMRSVATTFLASDLSFTTIILGPGLIGMNKMDSEQ